MTHHSVTPSDCLVIVDVQNDFCRGGPLAVPDGDAVVEPINRLTERFDAVVATQDWHPAGHASFASSHDGKQPFDSIELSYGPQVLWPDHCVIGTKGAEFHPGLDTTRIQMIVRKGFRSGVDSYSGFTEADKATSTGFAGYLRARSIDRIFVSGLATDFCVGWTAMDGRKAGFDVVVIEDACRGIDLDGSLAAAWRSMEEAGVERCRLADLALA